MATAGSIVVDLLLKTGSFETDAQRASKISEKRFKEIEKQAKDAATSVSGAFAGLLSGALLGVGVGTMFSKFIEETKNAQDEQAQLAAVLKSTGSAAGYTAAELNKMASGMAGFISEGDINRAQTRLLSYTGVVGEEFPRALQAAIDMSVRLGMTVEQSAETVGKALDVPSKGLDALSKQGFRFTEEQKKLVESLESTGRVAEAQDVVLKALESSYGGAAEAARDTLGGALQALQNQIDDLMTGDDASVNGLTEGINDLTDALGNDETKKAFATFLEGMANIATQAVQLAADFVTVADKAGGFVAALGAFGPGNGIGDLFRSDAENIEKVKQELTDLSAMQDRLNEGAAKWNDYNQKSLDVARKAAEARLSYYQTQVNRNEASVFGAYRGSGETGGPIQELDPVRVTGSASGGAKGSKEKVDQGQKLIDQMNQRIALIGKETEYEKLLEQVRIGSVTFKTEAQKNEALASAQTLDFINEQTKAYEESQKQAQALSKVLAELYPDQEQTNEYLSKLTLLTDGLHNGTLSAEEYSDAVTKLDEKFSETADGMSEFALQAARNIQDSLGDTLYDVLSGNFDNIGSKFADMILKMAANAAAANLAKALFGDFGMSGQIGGLIGTAIAGFMGPPGSGPAPTASQVGAAGDGLMFFADGGYTGAGGKYDPAGIVHAGEYVIPADATRRLGIGFLDRLKGYADGGYVGASGAMPSMQNGSTRVEIVNNGTPQQVSGASRSFDAAGEVIRIVVQDIRRNGDTARAIQGMA
jgi:phage-related minor tail protein